MSRLAHPTAQLSKPDTHQALAALAQRQANAAGFAGEAGFAAILNAQSNQPDTVGGERSHEKAAQQQPDDKPPAPTQTAAKPEAAPPQSEGPAASRQDRPDAKPRPKAEAGQHAAKPKSQIQQQDQAKVNAQTDADTGGNSALIEIPSDAVIPVAATATADSPATDSSADQPAVSATAPDQTAAALPVAVPAAPVPEIAAPVPPQGLALPLPIPLPGSKSIAEPPVKTGDEAVETPPVLGPMPSASAVAAAKPADPAALLQSAPRGLYADAPTNAAMPVSDSAADPALPSDQAALKAQDTWMQAFATTAAAASPQPAPGLAAPNPVLQALAAAVPGINTAASAATAAAPSADKISSRIDSGIADGAAFSPQLLGRYEGGILKPARPGTTAPGALPAPLQVAIQLARAAKTGDSAFNIQLHPAELGRVEVKLDVDSKGAATAHILADSQATLDLLQAHRGGLERALTDAGLQCETGGISFGLRDDGQNAQQQTGNRGHRNSAFSDPAGTADALLDPSTVANLTMSLQPGRVDIKA